MGTHNKKICCICGKPFKEWGNNPWPVKQEGQCCNECNRNVVLPARVREIRKRDANR